MFFVILAQLVLHFSTKQLWTYGTGFNFLFFFFFLQQKLTSFDRLTV